MNNKVFDLQSKYTPSPDQAKAIKEIVNYIGDGHQFQTLWGVTGSGKTFTMANVIKEINKPTLVIAHNKTLAAQLAQEFKEFFPNNAVHYFVSYYDYYQPEAYVAKTDTYIEKEATINEEIDRLRHAATEDLLTRRDVVIVASVSCIYGIGDIALYMESTIDIEVGKEYDIETILRKLVAIQYKRASSDFSNGMFRVKGDFLEIYPASSSFVYTIEFWGNEITSIVSRNHLTGEIIERFDNLKVFPAKHTVTTQDRIKEIIPEIKKELEDRLKYYEKTGDILRHERLKTKVEYDIEMMLESGYVNGIENYSRYLDGRESGNAPATLIDYFGDDFLCFVDESHMTFSQIGGMYAGDRSRKENLVENGFRLPSALDNRPLKFDEFEKKLKSIIAVSATPALYEIVKSCEDPSPKTSSQKEPSPLIHSSIQPSPLIPLPEVEGNKPQNSIDSIPPLPLGEGARGGGLNQEIRSMGEVAEKNASKYLSFNPLTDGVWESSSDCRIVPQMMRPTGLLDPEIILKPMEFMVDDIMSNISEVIEKDERLLVTTTTKKSSEELTDYLLDNGVKVKYLHSEVETLDRLEILKELREGKIDVIVGVNLLREGLDLPEVSKICILDADKQGFLRSETSLIQIIGRAARNENGKVYMYSEQLKKFDKSKYKKELDGLYRIDNAKLANDDGLIVSEAMRKAINLTYYRRGLQEKYNKENNITPKTILSDIKDMGIPNKKKTKDSRIGIKSALKEIKKLELEMDIASANLEFEKAAELRDLILELKKIGEK